MSRPAVKPLFAIAGLLPASMATAHANMRGPRDTAPAESVADKPAGVTVHVLQGDDDHAIPKAPVVTFTPRPSATRTTPTPIAKEKPMARSKKDITFGKQARDVVAALAAHGRLNTDGLVTAIKQSKPYVWNGCYQAKILKYITKVGTAFEVTPAGREALGKTTGSGGTSPAEKPAKKAAGKKAAKAPKATKRTKPTHANKLRVQSVPGVARPELPDPILRRSREFIPCGPASLSRAVKKFDGGMLVIEGERVVHELTAAQVAMVVDAEASAVAP